MSNSESPSSLEIRRPVNPKSRRAHRRESWWQIWFPLAVGILLIFGVPYLALSNGYGGVEAMSQVASMLLVIPMLLAGILLLVAMVTLIYLVSRVMGWLPPQAFQLQRLIQSVNQRVRRISDLAAKPVIQIESWTEAIQDIVERRR